MATVNVYLNFKGNTEEAFAFYRSVFGGEYLGIVRLRQFGCEGVAEDDLDKIAHIALPIGDGTLLMGTDVIDGVGKDFKVGTNTYIQLDAASAQEARQLFDALSKGGSVEMPLSRAAWAELYGSCTDRFGVQWMVNFTGEVVFHPDGGTPDRSVTN